MSRPSWGECASLLADLLLSTGERWDADGVVRGRTAEAGELVRSGVLVVDGAGWVLADGWRQGVPA